jgi:tetratricopeptide (TPR) repeat protein
MASSRVGKQIDDLIDAERWVEARALIKEALQKEPRSHWLLTQLGETYYEQQHYKKALKLLLQSRDILPDCPLTLWHLANTLDALAYPAGALRLYTWLLRSKRTPEDDPCWESAEWTDSLKTDCVFRMGLCFKHLGRTELAAHCFRKYADIFNLGIEGSYPVEDVRAQLQKLQESKREAAEHELREAADWVLRESGETNTSNDPPELDQESLRQLQEA